jgi:hypothetical protein
LNPRILATVIALPIALLTGVVVYNLGTAGRSPAPTASSQPSAAATSPVTVTATSLDSRSAVVCRALVAKLPERVHDAARRPVTAGAEQNAAYGDPPTTLTCGVPVPSFPATDDVYILDGVCWHPVQGQGVTAWTTVDREVPVAVTVPGAASGAAQWVIGFSGPIASAVPSRNGPIPHGCPR